MQNGIICAINQTPWKSFYILSCLPIKLINLFNQLFKHKCFKKQTPALKGWSSSKKHAVSFTQKCNIGHKFSLQVSGIAGREGCGHFLSLFLTNKQFWHSQSPGDSDTTKSTENIFLKQSGISIHIVAGDFITVFRTGRILAYHILNSKIHYWILLRTNPHCIWQDSFLLLG